MICWFFCQFRVFWLGTNKLSIREISELSTYKIYIEKLKSKTTSLFIAFPFFHPHQTKSVKIILNETYFLLLILKFFICEKIYYNLPELILVVTVMCGQMEVSIGWITDPSPLHFSLLQVLDMKYTLPLNSWIFWFFPAGFSVATIFNIQLFINGFIERLQNEIPSFLGGENALFKNKPCKK